MHEILIADAPSIRQAVRQMPPQIPEKEEMLLELVEVNRNELSGDEKEKRKVPRFSDTVH